MQSSASGESAEVEARKENRYRFELELEFVQSLANPHYLQALAQQNIMEDPSFILYLEYLLYWSEPQYAKFVVYPHALHHLQLLQLPKFRQDLKSNELPLLLAEKQFDHWRTWRSTSTKIPEASSTSQPGSSDTKPIGNGAGPATNGGAISGGSVPRTPHTKAQSRHGTPKASRSTYGATPQGTPRPSFATGTPKASSGTPRPGSNAPTPR